MKYFNPLNWFYFIKGHIKSYILKIYQKELVNIGNRASKCPECWQKGECIICGCSSYEMFLSNKPCKNG